MAGGLILTHGIKYVKNSKKILLKIFKIFGEYKNRVYICSEVLGSFRLVV